MAKKGISDNKRKALNRHVEAWLRDNGLQAYELRTLKLQLTPVVELEANPRAAVGNEPADKVLAAQISRLTVGRHEVGSKCLRAVTDFLVQHGAMTISEFTEKVSVDALMALSPKFGMAQLKVLNQALIELGYSPL